MLWGAPPGVLPTISRYPPPPPCTEPRSLPACLPVVNEHLAPGSMARNEIRPIGTLWTTHLGPRKKRTNLMQLWNTLCRNHASCQRKFWVPRSLCERSLAVFSTSSTIQYVLGRVNMHPKSIPNRKNYNNVMKLTSYGKKWGILNK